MRQALLCALVLLLAGCGLSRQERLLSMEQPSYTGHVSPITVPQAFRYKPASSAMLFELRMYTRNLLTGEETFTDFEMDMESRAEQSGDKLLWTTTSHKLTRNGKTMHADIPIFICRILTDALGNVHEYEISLPAFERNGLRRGSAEYAELVASFDPRKNIAPLNPNAVKSGDTLLHFDFGASAEVFKPINGNGKIPEILDGFTYHEGRKSLLVKGHFEEKRARRTAADGQGLPFDMSLSSYTVFDAETMLPLLGEAGMVLSNEAEFGKMHIRYVTKAAR